VSSEGCTSKISFPKAGLIGFLSLIIGFMLAGVVGWFAYIILYIPEGLRYIKKAISDMSYESITSTIPRIPIFVAVLTFITVLCIGIGYTMWFVVCF
jgi:hypothetical protein